MQNFVDLINKQKVFDYKPFKLVSDRYMLLAIIPRIDFITEFLI